MVKIISNVKGDHVEASVELAGNMKIDCFRTGQCNRQCVPADWRTGQARCAGVPQDVHSVRNERGFAYVARGQL